MDDRIADFQYSATREAFVFSVERTPVVFIVPREALNDLHGSNATGEALEAEFDKASEHIVDKATSLVRPGMLELVLTYALLSPGYEP